MHISIMATIVTYNPDILALKLNIDSCVSNHIDMLLIVDNHSKNIDEVNALLLNYIDKKIEINLIKNDTNRGIGEALNQAFEYALWNNYSWLLTLDQDSNCSDGYIDAMKSFIGNDVGIIYPSYDDHRIKLIRDSKKNIEQQLDKYKTKIKNIMLGGISTPITSGALMNVSVLNKVGGYDSKMFIDGIDIDMDLKVHKANYLIKECKDAILNHNLGSPIVREILCYKISASGHSPSRVYYMNRNSWTLYFRHRSFAARFCVANILLFFYCALKNAFVSKRYREYITAAFRGMYDGIKRQDREKRAY